MELCWDIEATGFLDDSNVDYMASPWKLKDHFKIHCIALECINTGEEFEFVPKSWCCPRCIVDGLIICH
jgi:hypothetical protein